MRVSTTSKARPRTSEARSASATAPTQPAPTMMGAASASENTRLVALPATTSSGATTNTVPTRNALAARASPKRAAQRSRLGCLPRRRRSLAARASSSAAASAAAPAPSRATRLTGGSTSLFAFSSMWSTRMMTRRLRRRATPSTALRATATPASAWMV